MSQCMPPMVFIHGFKGAHLDHIDTGKRHWLSGAQALGWPGRDADMPLCWEHGKQADDGLFAAAPLGKVLHVPVYQPFIRWCERRGRVCYPFAYDWRRDNAEAVAAFSDFLCDISARHAGQPVQVVAHSNGGLITYATLLSQPQLIHSVVFAATPFGGGIGMLEDLHLGVKTGLNAHLTRPQALFSFVTSFAFFPLAHECSQAFTRKGQSLPLDWYDLATWQEYPLASLLADAAPVPVQMEHLRNALRVTKAFRQRLVALPSPSVAIAVVASEHTPTLAAVQRDPALPSGWDFNHCEREPGDGRVRFSSCMPPAGVAFKLYKTRKEHSQVLSDFNAMGSAIDDLCAV